MADLTPATKGPAGLPVWAFITLMTLFTAVSSVSSNLFLPSMPSMTTDLRTDAATAQITVSGYTLAFAFAQLAWGPIGDRFGRRGVVIAGMAIYFLTSLGCFIAATIGELIAYRCVQAIGVCCGPVMARAIVRDVYELSDAARTLAYVSAAFALTPVIAPALGALIEEAIGWRGNFLFMAAFGGGILAAVVLLLRETAPTRRAAIHPLAVTRGYTHVLSSRLFLGNTLTTTLAFATIFIFNSVSPFFFIGAAGLTPTEYAIPYAQTAIVYGLTAWYATRVTPRLGFERTVILGLVVSLAGALAMLALVLGGSKSAWLICGAMGVVTAGFGFTFPNCQAGAVSPFPERAGAAAAMGGFMHMAVASIVGMAIMAIYDGSALPMALSVLGFIAASFAAYWFLIARHGPAR
jgi:DHA1 family bicyclomycin/chloramphenicol resistance-like MFS transporter